MAGSAGEVIFVTCIFSFSLPRELVYPSAIPCLQRAAFYNRRAQKKSLPTIPEDSRQAQGNEITVWLRNPINIKPAVKKKRRL
jgi:hypothetical protein